MEYMFLLYHDESRQTTPEQDQQARSRQWAIITETQTKGIFRGCSPLEPTSIAWHVRPEQDRLIATDGPFIETREVLGGYYILDCEAMDEAKYWAERMAQTGCASCVEIRQLMPVPGSAQEADTTQHSYA